MNNLTAIQFPEFPVPQNSDLHQRMQFLVEIEKLKLIYRQNVVVDGSRAENSAEHSWHIALMAILLLPHSDHAGIDLLRVVKMLLIHDIVEIDVGDTFLYDQEANKTKAGKEMKSAERIFGLLPAAQGDEFRELWSEFERRDTPDARYAAALDGMQPLVNHYASKGLGITKHGLKVQQIIDKKKYIATASLELWEYSLTIIDKSKNMGLYLP